MKSDFNSRRYRAPAPQQPEAGTPISDETGAPKKDHDTATALAERSATPGGPANNFIDFTDAYANQGKVISFEHVPSKEKIYFKAFITTYNETFNSDWSEEKVYGRNDPIYQFKSTTRRITLAFKVPAATKSEAFENLGRISKLAQFLYPYYQDPNNASTIAQSPLIRIQLMNMIASQAKYSAGFNDADDSSQYGMRYENLDNMALSTKSTAANALLGVVSNLTFAHNLENPDVGVIEYPGGILPKMIEVNLDFGVLHESDLGWNTVQGQDGLMFATRAFPYGIDLGAAHEKDAMAAEQARAATKGEAEASAREAEINQQAVDNAEGRYKKTKNGTLTRFATNRLSRDQDRMAKWSTDDARLTRRRGTIASAEAAQSGDTAHWTEWKAERYGGADYWDFIE